MNEEHESISLLSITVGIIMTIIHILLNNRKRSIFMLLR